MVMVISARDLARSGLGCAADRPAFVLGRVTRLVVGHGISIGSAFEFADKW